MEKYNHHTVKDHLTGQEHFVSCHSPIKAIVIAVKRVMESPNPLSDDECQKVFTDMVLDKLKRSMPELNGARAVMFSTPKGETPTEKDIARAAKEMVEEDDPDIIRFGRFSTTDQCVHVKNLFLAANKFAEIVSLSPENFTEDERKLALFIDTHQLAGFNSHNHDTSTLTDENEEPD